MRCFGRLWGGTRVSIDVGNRGVVVRRTRKVQLRVVDLPTGVVPKQGVRIQDELIGGKRISAEYHHATGGVQGGVEVSSNDIVHVGTTTKCKRCSGDRLFDHQHWTADAHACTGQVNGVVVNLNERCHVVA